MTVNLSETNAVLRRLVKAMLAEATLDYDPAMDLDANDVDIHGMDAATRKRLRVKKLHKHPRQKKARPPMRNRMPMSGRRIQHRMAQAKGR
jgi:hypothetical protein